MLKSPGPIGLKISALVLGANNKIPSFSSFENTFCLEGRLRSFKDFQSLLGFVQFSINKPFLFTFDHLLHFVPCLFVIFSISEQL